MSETAFAADFRALLKRHGITAPRFAYGAAEFDPAKPKVLYSGPVYGEDELVAATSALVEGKWSVAGEYVHRFEQAFSRRVNQAESVMVNSGSSADLLMIAAAKQRYGWTDGDGVLVSPVGFPTTISGITLNGLTPVFVDIEWDTLNADNDLIAAALDRHNGKPLPPGTPWYEGEMTCAPTIRAILVSPVLGNPPDMDRLTALATQYGVKLLLDGCDSLGTTWRGRPLAEYAAATTTSFFPSHHISTLQGGMVSSNDTELVRLARQMSTWGRACYCTGAANLLPKGVCGCRFGPWLKSCPDLILDHKYVFETATAYNLQPLDAQGAIGCVQLDRLEGIHEARRRIYGRLLALMPLLPNVRTATTHADALPSWFGFPFVCPDHSYLKAFRTHLEAAGIQTRSYFAGTITAQPGYAHLGRWEDQPNAAQVLRRVCFIGTNPMWTEAHLSHIESTVRGFVPPL